MRSGFHRSAHRYDFCFQYEIFEMPVSQVLKSHFNMSLELMGSIRLERKFGSNLCVVGVQVHRMSSPIESP